LPGSHTLDVSDQRGVEHTVLSLGGERAPALSRTIGRQIQGRQYATEPTQPVLFVGAAGIGLAARRFRDGVVRKGVSREGTVSLIDLLRIQRCEIAHNHAERPAVANDVMCGEDKKVFLLRKAQQLGAY
jgi:hypothetical protein